MTPPPQSIRAQSEQGFLELQWSESQIGRITFFELRCECPCASCVNEFTGERTLNPDDISPDVKPISMKTAGNYALQVTFSDGHGTGIYTWERLAALCEPVENE